jgi:hypothetical protein
MEGVGSELGFDPLTALRLGGVNERPVAKAILIEGLYSGA